jgi:hypothetical protein
MRRPRPKALVRPPGSSAVPRALATFLAATRRYFARPLATARVDPKRVRG